TTRRSQSIRRAISSVSNWSQSFQPSRVATLSAITFPPLPNSRSMVMIRIIVTPSPFIMRIGCLKIADASAICSNATLPSGGLVGCYLPGSARLIPFQCEGQQKHDGCSHCQEPIGIDVGQRRRLADHGTIEETVGLFSCLSHLAARCGQARGQPVSRLGES